MGVGLTLASGKLGRSVRPSRTVNTTGRVKIRLDSQIMPSKTIVLVKTLRHDGGQKLLPSLKPNPNLPRAWSTDGPIRAS